MSGGGLSDGVLITQSNEYFASIEDAIRHFKIGSPIYDAFSRLRISSPTTLFESKLVVSEENLLWDIGQVSGAGGSYTYSRDRASVTLKMAATTAGRYVRRTRRYFNYQPGKSQLAIMTCVPGASVDGVHKRMGYFDDNNGIYFGVNGESIFCAIRSSVTGSPVDTIVHQSAWNVDKFDGTGASGITIDPTLVQIFWFDFEWLGAGRVRWGIFYKGVPYVAHEFTHANQPGNTSVYMSTPVLPVSFEIDNNGIYFGVNGESIFCAVRSSVTGSPVDTIVHQSAWNVDKLDGTGASGITIDPTLVQIFWFDFEWLGAGRVRWGIFYKGVPYVAHEFTHANQLGNTSVYMSTPVLPVSFEIDNDGTGAYSELECICCSVLSEGGIQRGYITRSVDRGITGISVTSSDLVPVLSLRARDGFEFSGIAINTIDIIGTANQAFQWQLLINPTLNGVDAAVWTPVTSSTAEFDVTRSQTNYVTAGTVIDGGYVTAQNRGVLVTPQTFLGIGKRLLPATPKDEYVLACRNVGGNNTYYASISYEEIV